MEERTIISLMLRTYTPQPIEITVAGSLETVLDALQISLSAAGPVWFERVSADGDQTISVKKTHIVAVSLARAVVD